MDRKHAPDHHLLLLYILVATQVELGLQLTCGPGRGTLVNAAKGK